MEKTIGYVVHCESIEPGTLEAIHSSDALSCRVISSYAGLPFKCKQSFFSWKSHRLYTGGFRGLWNCFLISSYYSLALLELHQIFKGILGFEQNIGLYSIVIISVADTTVKCNIKTLQIFTSKGRFQTIKEIHQTDDAAQFK